MPDISIPSAGLIVPVDMTALCVGIKDQEDKNGTSTFAGATTSFLNQTGTHDAFLGSNVVRSLSDAPLHQLKKGIHLHWALPEALTRGNFDRSKNLTSFALAPNRWLLSRLVISDGAPSRKSWIIESDSLYDAGIQPPDAVVTLPVRTVTEKEQNYRYAGISNIFTAEWHEPSDPDKFKNLTGHDLSAVSSGDTSFAAFYPNCRNIFGFYDDMEDLISPAVIMYQLTGWYGKTENDPLHGGKTNAEIEEAYGWTFRDSSAKPQYSFYNGLTQSIEWDINKSYIVDNPNQKPIPATITIGNNPPETFSAYFRDLIHPDLPFFEDLLNAFQMGMLPVFQEPEANQLAELQELIHQKQFNPVKAGHIHLIIQKPDDNDINNLNDEVPATDLPLQLQTALNQLNIYQQQNDFYADYLEQFKGQLFANWYRLMKADSNDIKNELDAIIREQLTTYETTLSKEAASLKTKLETQKALVRNQIDALNAERRLKPPLDIKEIPATLYWQPNEPVLLITADDFRNNLRFGHTGKNSDGYLVCRIDNQLLQSIVANSKTITATQFTAINLPGPNNLPQSSLFNSLLQESCLLNTGIVAKLTGIAASVLEASLKTALAGGSQTTYKFTGLLPASKGVQWWNGNPWHPIMVIWETEFAPVQPTQTGGTLQNYNEFFFINNYKVNSDESSFIAYTGPTDPKEIFQYNKQFYRGSAILTPSAAHSFSKQLGEYLSDHQDATLQAIFDDLETGKYLSFAINGFANSLVMLDQDLQLNIKVPEKNPYYFLTESVAAVVGKFYSVSPETSGNYNPIRAGYMNAKLMAVDVYGNKREIKITRQLCAQSMVTSYNGVKEDGLVYMSPRIAQPTRLIFRWLAAAAGELQEMNSHPATSPVCGWLLPNHLDESLFFYDQQGRSLGNMFLNGNRSAILWQSAPGDNKTINKTVAEVFAYQNPQLAALANALMNSTPQFFLSFWSAIDSMHNFVTPQNFAQNSDLAVLIGRPVAVTQAMLRLETEGGPALNQSWKAIEATDNHFTDVQFPVILGDLEKINDGLIGYFKQGKQGFDFSTFYSDSADGKNGVVKPADTNLLLSVSPKVHSTDPADLMQDALKVLILVDPRAEIHATMGIMPTTVIDIPPDQYTDTISTFEMTFLTTPVLQGATGFNLPVPAEEGYQWSWIEEDLIHDAPAWSVIPDISFTSNQAVATYTPQTIREGWLKLNPQLLSFGLLNPAGQPVAHSGVINEFSLIVKNKKATSLKFTPGQLVDEGDDSKGSVFYIHFGKLIANDKVPDLIIEAPNWTFKCLNNIQYGNYWGCTPAMDTSLDPGKEITIKITKALVDKVSGQVQVYFDYYDITGINNGTEACFLTTAV